VTFLWDVKAPDVARAARPGHFVMARIDEHGERIPLTVANFDVDRGTVTVVIQAVGKTTHEMMGLQEGDTILDFIGPLGLPSHIRKLEGTVVMVGGGLGVAPIYPQLRGYKQAGNRTVSIIGFRNKDLIFWEDQFREVSDELIITTDDGSYGRHGFVTHALADVLANEKVSEVVAIGPIPMMKACAEVTRPYGIPTVVSLNSIMVDGTGMCGSCRVTVGGEMKFACVDGADFDGHLVNFDELNLRQRRFAREEKAAMERYRSESAKLATFPENSLAPPPRLVAACEIPTPEPMTPALKIPKNIKTISPERAPMPHQPPEARVHNFEEVSLGLDMEGAFHEAERCLRCKKPRCVPGCPVEIDIPGFISALARKDIKESYLILKASNGLPAVCGRVCPQESQCEATCVVGLKFKPVAIGRLERFVADAAMGRGWDAPPAAAAAGQKKAAIIGSGPAGLACAGDLARNGVAVTVFEALHVAGGVLKYGIPEFRLPDMIIDAEIETLKKMGVEIRLDTIIGKLFTIPQLLGEMGYSTAFVGTGAGSPKFAGIPGEAFNGVFSANEFLTRVNLMRGNRQPLYDTPVGMGKRVAVVGAGNTAMDSARVAMRMGAESVTVVYRRSRRESPARAEELEHAMEEGIHFNWLTLPVEIVGDANGWVTGMRCQKMELGEPDASGRRRPVAVEGSDFLIDVDTVIYALGTTANPIIAQTTPGLEVNKWNYIVTDERTGMTSIPGLFAGGDIVTGAATVILAMGAGKRAARGMLEYMGIMAPPEKPAELAEARSV
jgi:homotetrameric NADPH-dependent glutamate synthase